MKLTRREFLGIAGALGLSACAHTKLPLVDKLPLVWKREPVPFTVAAMNDLHVTDARSTAIVNRAIQKINANDAVRFSVVIGDVTGSGNLGEFNLAKESLIRLKKPYRVVPGNHDVLPQAAKAYANYEKTFGKPSWTHEEEDWLFIGLDSCEGGSSDVTVPQDRLDWLKERIEKVKPARPIALLAHHPFNPHTKQYRIKNADEILGLFSGRNLKLVASGHWHGNQVEEQNGILFTTTACCSSTRNNFDDATAKGFRLFHFDKDKVQTEFVEV